MSELELAGLVLGPAAYAFVAAVALLLLGTLLAIWNDHR